MGLATYLVRNRHIVIIVVLTCYVFFTILIEEKASRLVFSLSNNSPPENHNENSHDFQLERIDWNNYSLMESDSKRIGLGEQGIGATLNLTSEEQIARKKLLARHNYDAYLSDRISLERSTGDFRPEGCKRRTHMKNIPENSVSIIIPLFNDRNSTFLRSIHSIINRSPANLLREIIVVDDFSDWDELKAPLDDYVRRHFSKVYIIRNGRREGLIRSRTIGADASTGRFLVFLDSHIEVCYNFLPPLLEIIALNYKTIACPTIDATESDFKVTIMPFIRARGAFSWRMDFKRMPVPNPIDDYTPHANPIMVGGAFAITRKWWDEIGKYDQGLNIWGVEQYELSVKTWLCGGSIVELPCSRLAHVYRDWPYVKELVQAYYKNVARFAAVWLDGFREAVFDRLPYVRKIDPGDDILEQVELRKRLKCKPFDWFLTEVAPDMLKSFPIVEPPPLAWGHLISKWNSSLCAYIKNKQIYLANCSSKDVSNFMYDWRYHISVNSEHCLISVPPYLMTAKYHEILVDPVESFAWDPSRGRIVNFHSRLCIDIKPENLEMFMSDCVDGKSSQMWTFESFNSTEVVEAWHKYTKPL